MSEWKATEIEQTAISFVNVHFWSSIDQNELLDGFYFSIRNHFSEAAATVQKSFDVYD
jgi:hypothetical protein